MRQQAAVGQLCNSLRAAWSTDRVRQQLLQYRKQAVAHTPAWRLHAGADQQHDNNANPAH
jgi:hypothetical protein